MAIPKDVRQVVREQGLTQANVADTNARTFATVVSYGGLLTLALTTSHALAWLTFWVVGSILVCGGFAAVHEAIHGSLYKHSWANELAGVLWGLPLLSPFSAYRSWHFQHHVYTRTDRDPEPLVDAKRRLEVLTASGLAMIGLNIALWAEFLMAAVGRPREYAKRTTRPLLTRLNLLAFAAFAVAMFAVVGSWRQLAAVWLIPLIGGSVLSGFAVGHEHLSCRAETSNAFLHSRTIKSNRFARFVLWNANYHTGHHLVPAVTGRNLPQLQAHIDSRCVHTADSFTTFYAEVLRSPQAFHERAQNLSVDASAVIDIRSDSEYAARAGGR